MLPFEGIGALLFAIIFVKDNKSVLQNFYLALKQYDDIPLLKISPHPYNTNFNFIIPLSPANYRK